MKLKIHPEARLELDKAVDFYEERRDNLGQELFEEVQATLQRILDFPDAWPPLSTNTRRCLTHRFEYGVIYQVQGDEVRILAIAHQKRRPGYWRERADGF